MDRKTHEGLVPWVHLRNILAAVEKPGRYVGGEFGINAVPPGVDDYRICIVFPDLYEIAMSNQAVRILYKLFNDADGFHAERAFSAAPDFSEALKKNGIPLYSLESFRPVSSFHLLAVTIGYELSFTNLLSFLKDSQIPVRSRDRDDSHPLIIAGGPAMTNPLPWSEYLDGVFIGEAEGRVFETLAELKKLRASGASREEMLHCLDMSPVVWTSKSRRAIRYVWTGFGSETGAPAALPVPSMQPVQDHGVIEIMRGCPNKCRFCHAGVFYRPFRQKSVERILEEAEYLVNRCGYRSITLSSLSTGDYHGLEQLVDALNRRYAQRMVSFSLPSLRVSSVNLSLIGSLNEVRRSGLTFAVETPTLEGQRGINKEVPADHVISILNEAKSRGWKLAKFYFMLGLPVAPDSDEEQAIVDYLIGVQKETGMKINVNLGTFIPKPHTPYERSPQLTDEDAIGRIRQIRDGLRDNRNIKFSFHSPFVSFLEGILSRGDHRAGALAMAAWEKGAGFDAWDDRMNKEAWKEAISEADWEVEQEICRGRGADETLPWEGISLGITSKHLATESERSTDAVMTTPCAVQCTDHCGVCSRSCRAVVADIYSDEKIRAAGLESPDGGAMPDQEPEWRRLLVRFSKKGPSVYLGHLDVMGVFQKALQRSGIRIDFTRGFNPKPRIEFAQPLSLGVESEGEIGTIRVAYTGRDAGGIRDALQRRFPPGMELLEASWIAPVPEGRKTVKVMGAFWGSEWQLRLDRNTGSRTGSSRTPAELSDAVMSTCRRFGVDSELEILGIDGKTDSLKFRLRHGGTKNHNLMRILEDALGLPVLHTAWNVTRLQSLARGSDGEPVVYRTAFPEIRRD